MTHRDYEYCKMLAEREGWTLNYFIRRICNRFVTLTMSGEDLGVLPPPLEEDASIRLREAQ